MTVIELCLWSLEMCVRQEGGRWAPSLQGSVRALFFPGDLAVDSAGTLYLQAHLFLFKDKFQVGQLLLQFGPMQDVQYVLVGSSRKLAIYSKHC